MAKNPKHADAKLRVHESGHGRFNKSAVESFDLTEEDRFSFQTGGDQVYVEFSQNGDYSLFHGNKDSGLRFRAKQSVDNLWNEFPQTMEIQEGPVDNIYKLTPAQ